MKMQDESIYFTEIFNEIALKHSDEIDFDTFLKEYPIEINVSYTSFE